MTTATTLPGIVNLGAVNASHRTSDHVAFIEAAFDGSEVTRPGSAITHAALNTRADALARGLLARGLVRGDRLAILAANRIDSIALMLGAMRAGIVAVPVNHRFPSALIATVIADSGAKLVVCDAARRADCPPGLPIVVFEDDFEALIDDGPFEPIVPRPDEAALFLYTSGSTGRPKGVMLSHASHLWVVRVRMQGLDLANERYLIAAPLYHMNALALSFLALGACATVVLLPQFQARAYIETIGRQRCTWLTAVPPMIAMMLRETDALAAADFSTVRHVRMGSAPVSDRLALQIRALLPDASVVNSYGTTEGGPVVFGPHPDGLPTPLDSVGYPHPEVDVRIEADELGPDHGVLEMRSPAIMLGYHERPDVRNPITADGFYVTGDVFRRDANGFHTFVGRTDDMFVSGGENIFPSQVETVLETHPDVQQAIVIPVDDEIKGTKPVAFVVLRAGRTIMEEALKQHFLARAPAYQHPRRIWFVDTLPLASTNKVDRGELRRRAEAVMVTTA
ncbi:MAG: class I adenylate-forming enzyme family protein [Burkholderiaceae bacterium]